MNLNPRAQLLLKALVDIYITDGQPVGSKTLAQTSGLDVSSATIRNVMSQLDKQGLVQAPHTSAGRIPTEQGYRIFIDSLMEMQPLTTDLLGMMNAELNANQSTDNLINTASTLLSDFTKMAGIVTIPKRSQLKLRQIEFLPLPGKRILAILVINEKEVENRVIQADREYTQSELQTVSNIVNSQYAGKDIFSIRTSLVETLHQASTRLDQQMRVAASIADKALQQDDKNSNYVMQGASNLLNFSELEETGKLQQMFQVFNNTRDMLNILDRCINAEGVKVYVGRESGVEGLGSCSLITAPYMADGEVLGVLGVVGPTRMNYKNVIPVVEITAKLLGQALKSES
ncbi:MAG: heat-inducible transcriptional repressor HrcA [Gammaproteobacteria bacterium]|nr:heat-inducible transcriptional repressor HrcA [Gammaproteobacteria bacterium]